MIHLWFLYLYMAYIGGLGMAGAELRGDLAAAPLRSVGAALGGDAQGGQRHVGHRGAHRREPQHLHPGGALGRPAEGHGIELEEYTYIYNIVINSNSNIPAIFIITITWVFVCN